MAPGGQQGIDKYGRKKSKKEREAVHRENLENFYVVEDDKDKEAQGGAIVVGARAVPDGKREGDNKKETKDDDDKKAKEAASSGASSSSSSSSDGDDDGDDAFSSENKATNDTDNTKKQQPQNIDLVFAGKKITTTRPMSRIAYLTALSRGRSHPIVTMRTNFLNLQVRTRARRITARRVC